MQLPFILASRNLFSDKLRSTSTVVGIVFSIVLVLVQMGLYLGFRQMVTAILDHADADLWVVSKDVQSFEDLSLISTALERKVAAITGVERASPVVIGFSDWRTPAGKMTPVIVVGSDLAARVLQPWNVVDGSLTSLADQDSVAIDHSYLSRLGVGGPGDTAEIHGKKVRIEAVTDGIRSFTTTPYVFADLKRARSYLRLASNKASHLAIKLKPGADADSVRQEISKIAGDADILSTEEFKARSREFWLFGTGAGAALFAGALLGVIVGTVIVAQTLYSSTKDHIGEFATLRAMGCSKSYIYNVIRYQAWISAGIGFLIASGIGAAVYRLTADSALPIVITPELLAGLFVLTVVMCTLSATVAIVRVIRLDPVAELTR
jgi:putative ABC transport system permease protein